jgi:hypothetical protein
LSGLAAESVPQLAVLYDRFANALDPFSPERDQAELVFEQEVARLYDDLPKPKLDLHTFRKAMILRCRKHLRATDKPSGV